MELNRALGVLELWTQVQGTLVFGCIRDRGSIAPGLRHHQGVSIIIEWTAAHAPSVFCEAKTRYPCWLHSLPPQKFGIEMWHQGPIAPR